MCHTFVNVLLYVFVSSLSSTGRVYIEQKMNSPRMATIYLAWCSDGLTFQIRLIKGK